MSVRFKIATINTSGWSRCSSSRLKKSYVLIALFHRSISKRLYDSRPLLRR